MAYSGELCEMLGRLPATMKDTCAKKRRKKLPVLDARRPWLANKENDI